MNHVIFLERVLVSMLVEMRFSTFQRRIKDVCGKIS